MGLPIIVMIAIIIIDKTSLINKLTFLIPFVILVLINAILHIKVVKSVKCDLFVLGAQQKRND